MLASATRQITRAAARHQAVRATAARCMTTVVSTSGAPATPAIVVDTTPVVEKAKPAKEEPVVVKAKEKEGGSFRARMGGFLGGFALATIGYFVMLRGDVLEVTHDIQTTFVPVAERLTSQIGRLEKRVEELEKARK